MSKPRERLEQAQSGRLFLRKQDHRDLVVNDIYHNAIWVSKWQEDEETKEDVYVDELGWAKYPKNALINLGGNALGWVDTDRQFNYAYVFGGGQRTTRLFRLEEICVVASSYTVTDQVYYTEDGIVWKRINNNIDFLINRDVHYFGKDMICTITGTTMKIVLFEKNEETEEWTLTNYTTTVPNNCFYCCRTNNGCIVCVSQYINNQYTHSFHEVMLGSVHARTKIQNVNWNLEKYRVRECSRTDFCGFIATASYRLYQSPTFTSDTFRNRVIGFVSMDDFRSESHQFIYSEDNTYYNSWVYLNNERADAFVRDGYMYCIYQDLKGNGHLWRTLTQQWNEVELPDYVDLPIAKNGGKCVGNPSKTTFRFAIKANTPNADGSFSDGLSTMLNGQPRFNGNTYNVKFSDGEIQNWTNEDEFLSVRSGGYILIFDNLRFVPSTKSFAFQQIDYSEATDGNDYLNEYDYCVWVNPFPDGEENAETHSESESEND